MTAAVSLGGSRRRRKVVFWRHGRTSWNSAGRFQGQEDIALDEVGRQQAASAAALLAAIGPTRIISSDLERARHTAEALARVTGLSVAEDPRLRETHAGAWQGMTFAEINATYPDEAASWSSGAVHVRPGGGESRLEVSERMSAAVLEAVSRLDDGGTLVVATHGGAARVGIASLLGLPHDHWGVLSGLANCNWSLLEETDSAENPLVNWRLTEHNAGTLPQPVTVQEG